MLSFFDCNAAIGRWKHPRYGGYETATELETILDYLQVGRAVVYHAQAHENHAPLGNAMLMRELDGYAGHRFSMEPWCAGPLLEELAAHRMPVLIDFMFFRRDDPDWRLLYDLCQRYPTAPIVLTGWSGLASRSFYPLCQACPNLYLETSGYALFRGLEAFCGQVGARQLLYGSGLPFKAPGVAMTTLTHAFISAEEKELIAAGNLERLLEEVML